MAIDVATIEIRVLGPVEASIDGRPIDVGGPRQRALLGLLALQPGRIVGVDWLIEELWRGAPPDGAEATLRSYVSRLRHALGHGAGIRGTSAGYALDVAPASLDAARFEAQIREAEAALGRRNAMRAAALSREALDLWRGRPFGELGDDGALGAEAQRLDELRLHGLELRNEAELELGASAALVDELEALVREHPYRERYWRQLMLAL